MQLPSNGQNQIAYRFLESFFRHQKLFWVAVLGISSVVMVTLYIKTKSYTATASTQVIAEQEVDAALGYPKDIWISPAQQNVNRFNDYLKDDTEGGFVDTAIKQAHLKRPISVDPRVHDPRLGVLYRKLTASADSNDVFSITLTWDDATDCENLLRSFQEVYIEEAGISSQRASVSALKFLDGQIASYGDRLRAAEQALVDYKRDNMGQTPEEQTAEAEQLSTLKTKRDTLVIASKDATLKRAALEERLSQIQPTMVLQSTTADGAKTGTPDQIALGEFESQRAELLSESYLPTSDRVQALDSQINATKLRIAAAEKAGGAHTSGGILQTTTQANPEYRTVMEQLTAAKIAQALNASELQLIGERIAQYQQHVQNMPAAVRVLMDKTRDSGVLKTQYESLLKQREEVQVKASLDKVAAKSTLRPLGSIYAPSSGGIKKTAMMFVGSLILGIVMGCGLVVLAEYMDPSIRYESDLERLLEVPSLISLPHVALIGSTDGNGSSREKSIEAADDPVLFR